MFKRLQIYDPRERALVGLADLALAPIGAARWFRRPASGPIRRILLMRLERIGDLLMVLEAVRTARDVWPGAEIDLAVGSWNAPIAALVPDINNVVVADVPWLSREGTGLRWGALITLARSWRKRDYDLVINFEPDIRSNLLAWLTRAPRRIGYWTGGGGGLLTEVSAYDPSTHVSTNAVRLVARAAGTALPAMSPAGPGPALPLPATAVTRAAAVLDAMPGPWIGVHASGGRESKQWHLDRFAAVARALAETHRATIVLTGSSADRPVVDEVMRALGSARVIDAAGAMELPVLAALLARLDVLVTGDTGPMHLAAAVGTPVVALFGPSDPKRYGPLGRFQRVLRIDLPCSPCGQVRLPPERCRGHVPDCLDGIHVATVVRAVADVLEEAQAARAAAAEMAS